MRHPFDGITPAADVPAGESEQFGERLARCGHSSRRGFMATLGALSAAVAAALAPRVGQALQSGPTTGQTGSMPPSGSNNAGGRMTTYAVGEEGGQTPPSSGGTVTTFAVGEEGGTTPPSSGGTVTTYAVGEEGGGYPRYPSRRTYYHRRPWWRWWSYR